MSLGMIVLLVLAALFICVALVAAIGPDAAADVVATCLEIFDIFD